MKTLDFQRYATYDTDQEGDTIIDFPKSQQWKMMITHLRFDMPDGITWDQPIAYLKIYSDASQFVGTVQTNGLTKMRDNALPVMFPDQLLKSSVVGIFRGFSNIGPVGFSFALLDDQKKKVDVQRIILFFTITAEDGKI